MNYTIGLGLPYNSNNHQLPAYEKVSYSAAECVGWCTSNRNMEATKVKPGCVAASFRSYTTVTDDVLLGCVLWQASYSVAAPAYMASYTSHAGTTTTNPTKVVEPSTLPESDTEWAERGPGWSTWMFDGALQPTRPSTAACDGTITETSYNVGFISTSTAIKGLANASSVSVTSAILGGGWIDHGDSAIVTCIQPLSGTPSALILAIVSGEAKMVAIQFSVQAKSEVVVVSTIGAGYHKGVVTCTEAALNSLWDGRTHAGVATSADAKGYGVASLTVKEPKCIAADNTSTTPPPPTPATPTPAWEVGYISGAGLPYSVNNQQLPVYAKAADSAAECVERCTADMKMESAKGGSGCVAASWRTSAGPQKLWCVQWEAYCTDGAPDNVPGFLSEAGTTTTLPSKIAEPSTLNVNATAWATRELGWSTWMLKREGYVVGVMVMHGAPGC